MAQRAVPERPVRGLRVGLLYSARPRLARGTAQDVLSELDTLQTVAAARRVLRKAGARVVDLGCPPDDPRGVIRRLTARPPEVVINLCDCPLGDSALEPAFPALLDLLAIPFTGAPPFALALCRDKPLVKRLLAAAGVPTPEFAVVAPGETPARWRLFPAIVKPAGEDASCGIDSESVVTGPAPLARRVAWIHRRYRQPALVERYVDGREINVALVGDRAPRLLPPGEIDFSELPAGLPRIVGFRAKWCLERPEYRGTRPVAARPLPRPVRDALERHALAAWRLTGCRDYARVDFRLDARLRPFVLEVNPNPDLAPDAGLARAWARAGGDWPGLLLRLLGLARARRRS